MRLLRLLRDSFALEHQPVDSHWVTCGPPLSSAVAPTFVCDEPASAQSSIAATDSLLPDVESMFARYRVYVVIL